MQDCIFCKIIQGEIPSTKIFEDDKALAFLDITPVNPGHTLVIPKEHYKDIHELPEELSAHLMKVVKKLSTALRTGLPSDGVNVSMNNEGAAGQVVFHAHIHVIPRHKDDGFELWHGKQGYKEGEKEEVARKIVAGL